MLAWVTHQDRITVDGDGELAQEGLEAERKTLVKATTQAIFLFIEQGLKMDTIGNADRLKLNKRSYFLLKWQFFLIFQAHVNFNLGGWPGRDVERLNFAEIFGQIVDYFHR